MPSIKQLPPRSKVKTADTWDLSSLFPNDEAWEKAFAAWEKRIAGYADFQGRLGNDAETLAACLKFDEDFDRAGERLGTYAHLKTAEDTADSRYQRMQGRYVNVAGRAAEAASYIRPEILAIPTARMKQFLARRGVGALPAAAGATAALQAAHAGQERGKAAGDADRDGPGRRRRSSAN